MKRPIVVVDVDQVLLNFFEFFCRWHNRNYGTAWRVEDINNYNLTEVFDIDMETLQGRFDESDADGPVPVIDGSLEGTRRLVEMGYALVVVSDRPISAYEKTRTSLVQAFGDIFSGIYLTGQRLEPSAGRTATKGTWCRDLGAVVAIDDYSPRLLEIRQQSPGTRAYLFGNWGWNKSEGELPDGIVRASTWGDVVREVAKRG